MRRRRQSGRGGLQLQDEAQPARGIRPVVRIDLLATTVTGIIAAGMTAITLSGNFFSLGVTASVVLAGVIYIWVATLTGNIFVGALNTSVLYALLFNACMFAIAWTMWRRRWFIKV